ncbi:MAG: crotonase/enoyl-CoA hydratase family protein [Salaquimonas sp.]|nr:crotonase/enoyl-CoA hydratase family protein [Salaquimonas sp.]
MAFFELTREGSVAKLVMNRPDKANGMTPEFWAELPKVVRELDADSSVRALVIAGNGRHFTGGMDLASFQQIMHLVQKEPGRAAFALRQLILTLQDSFTALEVSRLPVIAAIHGACIGGGIDMISACDLRLASKDASFSIEEIHVGMTADVGTLQRLPKLIPPGVVKELAFTGRRFSPVEALAWGFVNEICEDDDAVQVRAMELAGEIAEKSPLAIAGIKHSVDYARDHTVRDGLDQIATWNAGMLRPEDLSAALQAKMAKKAAVFADLEKLTGLGG